MATGNPSRGRRARARCGAHVIEQTGDIGGQFGDVVVLDRLGSRGPAVSALVGGQNVVPGRGQGGYLVAPRMRQFGEAVGQHDDRIARLTGLGHPQRHAIGIY